MVSSGDGSSPFYISSHSADVILSDIRPIKLKIDALRSINVLLDEFLFNILKSSRSLTTNKLRAGLLSVLPTTLGKEALLEAEVELRAYWDRTKRPKGSNGVDDDNDSFNLQWAFELLRLKCEAYSTLNESDEDSAAESRLHDRMSGASGVQPPKPSLVAPAALYLTAILEAMCEHILSNVGRVAARDSSRTTATLQDVFIALCEDDSIYTLFKTMNVYEQIEQQAQETRPRRSKSISRTDKLSMSRTSSGSPTPTSKRLSSEGSSTVAASGSGHRSSFEKAKSMKKFIGNGRNSGDRDSASIHGHKKSDSVLSDQTKQTWAQLTQADDDSSLQEFDDLMRSEATMKVSLTPDRLKTMEVYKQEKQERDRSNRQRSGDSSSVPSRPSDNRRPSVRNVDSIKEDEEEVHSKSSQSFPHRTRQASVTSPPKSSPVTTSRSRSVSAASQPISAQISRKSSKTGISSSPLPTPLPTMQSQARRTGGMPKGFDADPFPQKTRRIQHNRESLDLDDVMAGSDAEEGNEEDVTLSAAMNTPKRIPAAKPKSPGGGVSASTRDLMDFLNEGPPPMSAPGRGTSSKSGKDLMDFLDAGPSDYGLPPPAESLNGKNKGSTRLQRMMSKLSIGNEKSRNAQDEFGRRMPPPSAPTSPIRPGITPRISAPNLAMLANRPVPPRITPQPQMISPPSSPVQPPEDSLPSSPPSSSQSSRKPSIIRKIPQYDLDGGDSIPPSTSTPPPSKPHSRAASAPGDELAKETRKPPVQITTDRALLSHTSPSTEPRTPRNAPRKQIDNVITQPPSAPSGLSRDEVQELRRHLLRATNSDECRLVLDIFISKAGIPVEPAEYDVPYPSPSTTDVAETRPSNVDVALESSLVELFLGGENAPEPTSPRKKKFKTQRPTPIVPPRANGQAINSIPTVVARA